MIIAMIPARMGSQRLKKKNLQKIDGIPIITHAIRKCVSSDIFDEIWVNSEHDAFGEIAKHESVYFHKRPNELANNTATSEDFIYEFLVSHPCEYLFQVHSIAPLLTSDQIVEFVKTMREGKFDVLCSVVNEQIECAIKNKPINFCFNEKTNSQNLVPIQRITWSITAWKSITFINAVKTGKCATYSGKVGFHAIDRMAGHIIKTKDDLDIAQALFNLRRL